MQLANLKAQDTKVLGEKEAEGLAELREANFAKGTVLDNEDASPEPDRVDPGPAKRKRPVKEKDKGRQSKKKR